MAEIEFLHEYGDGDDESPFWSHDTAELDLPPSDLGLGFPISPEDDDVDDDYTCGFVSADCDSLWRREIAFSDSDNEIEADDVFESSNQVFEENNDVFDDDRTGVQMGWDSFRLDEDRVEREDDFEWEEVVDEREGLSVFFDADVDDDVDVSVSMEIVEEEEEELGIDDQVTNLEWELLLNIHNLDPNVDNGDDDDYEMLVGTEGRKPPASRAVIEGLETVVVTNDDVECEDCAICKDDMGIGEKVKYLPCLHRYHGFCIDIWLGMRNTCPVCRFELPTDDVEYERRRRERGGRA